MKKIILCPNPVRDAGLKLASQACRILEECGAEPVCCPVLGEEGGDLPVSCRVSDLKAELDGADMVIAFGGDGTMLHTARAVACRGIPVLGVNMGKKGFITDIERDEIHLVRRAAAGEYEIDRRMMLDAEIIRDGEAVYSNFALNEVMVGCMFRIIDLAVYADGREITRFSGDGVLAATPTGSTAYSMSAGGPIVEPTAENIIITPVCAHGLTAKALVLAPHREVEIRPVGISDRSAYITIDGGDPEKLVEGDVIRIRRSAHETKLIHLSQRSFYEKIRDKLGEKP